MTSCRRCAGICATCRRFSEVDVSHVTEKRTKLEAGRKRARGWIDKCFRGTVSDYCSQERRQESDWSESDAKTVNLWEAIAKIAFLIKMKAQRGSGAQIETTTLQWANRDRGERITCARRFIIPAAVIDIARIVLALVALAHVRRIWSSSSHISAHQRRATHTRGRMHFWALLLSCGSQRRLSLIITLSAVPARRSREPLQSRVTWLFG